MIFGEEDSLSDFSFQKNLMYKIDALESVKFLAGYTHISFTGREEDDKLQKMILEVMNGDTESDKRWTEYLETMHKKEEYAIRKQKKKEERKSQLSEIAGKIAFWT